MKLEARKYLHDIERAGRLETTLGDQFTLQRGTTYKSRLLGRDGPVLLGLASIHRNGGFRTDALRTYGGDCPEKLLDPGDLYVSLKDVTQSADLLGSVAMLPAGHASGRLTQDTVKLEPKRDDIRLDYIHWLLRTPEYRHYCRAHATGTTNLGLPREDFLAYPVPPLTPERECIVDALDALDGKIEQNRRMNRTLEAVAQALFKSWFVDFEPVRAKVEGRDTGLPEDIADLFPHELADVGRGNEDIPVGWSTVPLNEIAEFLNGLALQKYPMLDPEHSLPVIKIAELRNGVTPKTTRASNVPTEYVVRDGDFLFSWSGSLMAKFWINGPGALNQHLFKVTSSDYPTWFFTQWVQYHLPTFRRIASGKATTMGHIQRHHLAEAMTVCPPTYVLLQLDTIMSSLLRRSITAQAESRMIARIRDELLPNLVSGELRVPDTERIVAAVV